MLYIEKSKSEILEYFEIFRRLRHNFRYCEIDIPIKQCNDDKAPESFIYGKSRKYISKQIASYLDKYNKDRSCSIALMTPVISNTSIFRLTLCFNSEHFIGENYSDDGNALPVYTNIENATELHEIVNRISDIEVKLEATDKKLNSVESLCETEIDIRKEFRKIWSFLQTVDIKLDKLERHRIKATETPTDSINTDNSEKYKPQPTYIKSKNGIELKPGTPVFHPAYRDILIVCGNADNNRLVPVRLFSRYFDCGEGWFTKYETIMVKPEYIEAIEI